MEKKIIKLPPMAQKIPQLLDVAGYARVSSDKMAMLESLSAQVSYYSDKIQNTPGWRYAGVYADEAITGTKDARPEFQKLLQACRDGKVGMIITKSVSQFARNVVTLLEVVRELKALGVDVFFERECLHTLSGDGELMLTLLACFAQEESRSVSDNCKWRIRSQYSAGFPVSLALYGYKQVGNGLVVVEEEARIIRQIFDFARSGLGKRAIARKLDECGIAPPHSDRWQESTVSYILQNEKYIGDMLLQKTFVQDHITKHKKRNKGELPTFYVDGVHEAIIDRETFDLVQQQIQERAQKYNPIPTSPAVYPFTGKLVCGCCGKHYRRKIGNAGTKYAAPVWVCGAKKQYGRDACAGKQVAESALMDAAASVLALDQFDPDVFAAKIAEIHVETPGRLTFLFHDGQKGGCQNE